MKIKEVHKLPDAKVFIFDKDPKEVSIKQIIGDEKTIFFPFLKYGGPARIRTWDQYIMSVLL